MSSSQPVQPTFNVDAAVGLVPYVKRPRKPRLPRLLTPEQEAERRRVKRRYIRTSDADRRLVISMFANQGKTAAEIAETLNGRVSVSNVYRIIRTFQKEDRIDKLHSGGSKLKFTEEERKFVALAQSHHNDWTYNQIRDAWKQRYGPNKSLSTGTIANILREYGVTTKQLYVVPQARNSDKLIEERFRYAQLCVGRDSDRVIYVDEMGFSLHRSRRRGRSIIGRRATITRPNGRGGNISVCAAISPKYGLMKKQVQFSSFETVTFMEFLIEVFRALPQDVQHLEHYIVMDNCNFHHSKYINAFFAGVTHKPSYVPAYSPQLNAIEECFSSVASYVNTQRMENQTALLRLIDHAFDQVTVEKCAKWHEHVVKWLRHCLDKKPLESHPLVDEDLYRQIRAANTEEEKKDVDDEKSDMSDIDDAEADEEMMVYHNDLDDVAHDE